MAYSMRRCILLLPLLVAPARSWVGAPQAAGSRKSRIVLASSASVPSQDRLAEGNGLNNNDGARHGAISMSVAELSNYMGGTGRAKLVWDCYKIGVDPQNFHGGDASNANLDQDEIENIIKLLPSGRRLQKLGDGALQSLANSYQHAQQVEDGVACLSHLSTSSDLTTKMLLKLHDGLEVETVIIPVDGRSTLCISSQVGCRQCCTFCATGRMGRLRSLSSDEILAQMFFGRKICRIQGLPEISNIVFMGMGEPADNAAAVVRATEILTTRECFQLSSRKVTVSTVAPSPDSFRLFVDAPCVLAWSVHAANDQLRRQLVPTTKYTMAELRQGLIDTLKQRHPTLRTTMLEVTLIDGVNDGLKEAQELAEFARVIVDSVPNCKLIVNLIPFNDIGHKSYRKPSNDNVWAFQKVLWDAELRAHIRTTRGDDESAACGQLSTLRKQSQQ